MSQLGQLGLFRPDSDWVAPKELPDLRGRPIVAIDTEGRDDGLATGRGPGWPLGPAGYTCGVSWAAEGTKGYVPIRHPESDNFPVENVMRWVDDLFKSGTRIVFHNASYDIGWLGSAGVSDPVHIEDTSAAAVMISEQHRSYSLDSCLKREGLPLKSKDLLYSAAQAYGGDVKNPVKTIYLYPAKFVGPYAEDDADRTLDLWRIYETQLRAQGVWDAYRLEMDLIPIVVAMRRRGIRIHVDKAEQIAAALRLNVKRLCNIATDRLSHVTGGRAVTVEDLRSAKWLERAFTAESLRFPRTAKSKQGSFAKEWMQKSDHWLPKLVVDARHYEDAASKQIDNFLLSFVTRGRLHAEIHQFKTDEGGTRSQRFSYANPPLQQMEGIQEGPDKMPIPEGDEPWEFFGGVGGAIRSCFLPEKGQAWLAGDYSQQEPRMTVHFASVTNMPGAEEAVRRWHENPKLSYHNMVQEMTGLSYKNSKILNLAATYGKRAKSLSYELGLTLEEAEELLENYHHRVPYVKPLEDLCKSRAASRGFIRLIDGARMHYDEWEGPYFTDEERLEAQKLGHRMDPCSFDEAKDRAAIDGHPWNGKKLRRADTRKALNNLIQGSAARQTKRAVRECYRAGYLPLIQMHDELGSSVDSGKDVETIGQIMLEAIPLRVPVLVDLEVGDTWGDAKYTWAEYEEMKRG